MNKILLILMTSAILQVPAAAETVVIVSASNPMARLSAEDAAQFFLGKSSLLQPVDLDARSAIRADFYRKLADKDLSEVRAMWSKLIFTGKARAPKEYASSAEVRKVVAADARAIGYIDRAAVDATVHVVLALP